MHSFILILCLLLSFTPLYAHKRVCIPAKQHESVIFNGSGGFNTGLFFIFSCIVGALRSLDSRQIASLSVDFGSNGFYYDEKIGENWWGYYFDSLLSINNSRYTSSVDSAFQAQFYLSSLSSSREENYRLISKYIQIKKPILDEVNQFEEGFFKGRFVVGIHYRGTDKFISESPSITPDKFLDKLEKEWGSIWEKEPLFFVATDVDEFIKVIEQRYPGRVVFHEAERSIDGNPLHSTTKSPYEQGREALIDCLLLSRTHFLARTGSNLSLVSTWFNPSLPTVVLNPNALGL
jgi:hypothetical protein